MADRAAARHAARALAKGAGVRGASALPTGEADKLAVDALASVSSGAVDGQAKPGGDGGELVLADQPKRNKGGNPAWVKGVSGRDIPARDAMPVQIAEQSPCVETSTVSESRHIIQNQLVGLGGAFHYAGKSIEYIGRMVDGRAKVSAALRFQASCKILDMCGISADAVDRLEKLKAAPGGGVDLANLAGSLARAAELANRRKQAETVPITGQNSGNARGEAA